MQKGKLSYYSSTILGLLGLLFLILIGLSFSGVNNGPGDFLRQSFTYAAFFIPLYIIAAAVLAFGNNFRLRWVIVLTSTIIPFLTLTLFLKVYSEVDNSAPVKFVINTMGRKEGAFLLFLLLLIEILLVYLLSIKVSKDSPPDSEHSIPVEEDTSSEFIEPAKYKTDDTSVPAVLRLDNLPELPVLKNLKSIPLESVPGSEAEKGFTIDYGDSYNDEDIELDEIEELDELIPEPDDQDNYATDYDSEEYEDKADPDPEEEVFLEVGEDHLINTEHPAEMRDKEENVNKAKKKFTYANYNVPSKNILNDYAGGHYWVIDDQTRLAAGVLKETLEEFKIKAEVTGIQKGPVITMFEILPAPGVKLSKIANLADNIAMRLAASRVRIVAPIPGKHAVGIEIPNKERAKVSFKEMLQDDKFQDSKNEIPIAIGKDITGNTQIIDLVKTPHLLIAGATGSGKSVCVNSLICSILYKRSPDQVRLLLIDPKIVELKLYNDIPHLLTPVITEPKRAFQALQYCIYIMEQRYALLDSMGVRDIRSYNRKIKRNRIATKALPYIVVIVDEFADLIATSGKELESILARLAAMARAVGIHLVLATQRPSIDVITGLIKANIPSRIAFMVSNKIDSRIILDTAGADKLLGQGDMLFSSAWDPALTRIQGAFLSDSEVEAITSYVKTLGEPDYIDDEIFYDDTDESPDTGNYNTSDPLMDKAVEIVVTAGKASASYLQRRLQIGYNRAARIVEDMEARGIVGPPNGSKPREILHVPDRIREE